MDTIIPVDELGDLAVFVRVVETRGFSAAARQLGLTKSAVSKRINRLERRLGLRLLQRTTRAMSLTEAGRLLHARAAPAVAELEATRRLAEGLVEAPRGTVQVTASVTFGKLCLAPLLPDFLARYPEVDVRLVLLDRFVDLVDEGYDVALRLTRQPPPNLVARALMPVEYRLVATADYLRGRTVAHPAGLDGLNGLHYHGGGEQTGERVVEWQLARAGEVARPRLVRRIAVNNSEVVRDLVLAGQGVGLVWNYAVDADIAAGRLLHLLPDWQPAGPFGQTAWALWPQQTRLPLKTRVFIDFLGERLGKAAAAVDGEKMPKSAS
jgi:DNA-binding transcriptional LysR family regulator